MAHNTTNVLITGCARGIGRSLVAAYLRRPNHTVIAAVRDPASTGAKTLENLEKEESSSLIVIKIDSSSDEDPSNAVSTLRSKYSIDQINVVIANAGISNYFGPARTTPPEEMRNHFNINVVAVLMLFQAVSPLLLNSFDSHKPLPKFVTMSSGAGSISGVEKLKVENTAYGASKAALNFVTRRIHAENDHLIAFPINPGWLQTELGNHAASASGMSAAPLTVDQGVAGIMKTIDQATKETTSGRFMSAAGGELDW